MKVVEEFERVAVVFFGVAAMTGGHKVVLGVGTFALQRDEVFNFGFDFIRECDAAIRTLAFERRNHMVEESISNWFHRSGALACFVFGFD